MKSSCGFKFLIGVVTSRVALAQLAPAATGLSDVIPPPIADGGKAWTDAYDRA